MAEYRPALPFSVPMALLIPTKKTESGVVIETFPAVAKGARFNGSFRTYGGTERMIDGVYAIEDTATIETWYRPDITSDCRIAVLTTGAVYEILGEPENISLRNQYLRIKVTRYKGNA